MWNLTRKSAWSKIECCTFDINLMKQQSGPNSDWSPTGLPLKKGAGQSPPQIFNSYLVPFHDCISGMPTHKLLLCYYVPLCCWSIWFALSAIWMWWQSVAGGCRALRWLLIAGLAGAYYMTYCSMHEGRPTQHSVAGSAFVQGIWQKGWWWEMVNWFSCQCWIYFTFELVVGYSFRLPVFLPLPIEIIIKLYENMLWCDLFIAAIREVMFLLLYVLILVCPSHKLINEFQGIGWTGPEPKNILFYLNLGFHHSND